MDRTDRFVNNRAPKLLLGFFLTLFLCFLIGGWFLSGMLAGEIVHEQIGSMLALAGGGAFLDEPDTERIRAGEELFSAYGVHAEMSASLMPQYSRIRNLLFLLISCISGSICLLGCAFSLRRLDRIYTELEELRADCFTIAEELEGKAALRGEDFGCVRRICEGVNLIAGRMAHLSGNLYQEKQFLKDFLTDFSHQMKTSLTVVRLNTDLLHEAEHLPEAQKYQLSEEIMLHLDSMEELVLSTLKLAKLNADAVVYTQTDTDLCMTCNAAIRRMQPLLRQKAVAAQLDAPDPVSLPHDHVWLCEAVCNLLKNAADHSGCTELHMELTAIPGAVKLSVADNGKGMPQSEIPQLFERFGKKSGSAVMQSAGVGLAIARQIIEAHNGEICVYSEIGKGTRFEILFLK